MYSLYSVKVIREVERIFWKRHKIINDDKD